MTSVPPTPIRHYPLNDASTLLLDATGNASNPLTNVDSVTIVQDPEFGNVASFGGTDYLLLELPDVPPDVYGLDSFWAKNNDTSVRKALAGTLLHRPRYLFYFFTNPHTLQQTPHSFRKLHFKNPTENAFQHIYPLHTPCVPFESMMIDHDQISLTIFGPTNL